MRINLERPEHTIFSTEIEIRIADLTYFNHLGNDKLLAYAQQSRYELFKSWGYSELDLAGVGVIMGDAGVVFQSQGHLGDILRVDIGVKDVARVSFDLYHQFTNIKTGKEVALVKTGIICFDYEKQKVVSIPEVIKQRLG